MIATITPSERRLLIIDDDLNTAEVIREALVQAGYQVQVAHSADEGLDKIRQFSPHLILTDQDMPGVTGLDMLQKLRQQRNYVTVIFVSGRSDSALVAQALRSGADDYIRKPFRFDELLARVEATLRTYDLHHELLEANTRLQEMVLRDDLTGLYNMRTMYDRIDSEIKRARRFKRQVACVMLDMDHFKSVNDKNDHLFGSFVLKEVGQIVQQTVRETDFAARYGGDEFLIVLVETNESGVKTFCERLRSKIQKHKFVDGTNSIQLTVSMGYSISQPDDQHLDARQIVRSADHALYKAKEQGRNRYSGN